MVPNIPFTFAQAKAEFGGTGKASELLTRAKLGQTGVMSQLAGQVLFQLVGTVTTNQSPYMYFTFDGTYTICHHNHGGVQQNYQLQKGRMWIKLGPPTATANFENCSQNQWFMTDGTLRGLRKYQQGVAAFETYFSWSNGGAVIASPIGVLSWP